MSFKNVRTVADMLRFGCSLKVECTFCGNSRTLSAVAAAKGLGDKPLKGASRRFRCLRCGYKQARIQILPPV
jgi:ribosomal protein L44E